MIETGSYEALGAIWDGDGVNFALYSSRATAVELCLFDPAGRESRRIELPACTDDVWHGYLPGAAPGQRYGYRVHGPHAPEDGLWFNPNKLLIDPYARQLTGSVIWVSELFADPDAVEDPAAIGRDSAPFVPKSVVTGKAAGLPTPVRVPWRDTLLYEAHVRGYTMRHPAVDAADRGRFRGLARRDVLAHIRSLGVTSLELMPVHAYVDEQFLDSRGLRNYWGYNTLGFFAPEARYLAGDDIEEFRQLVNAIHEHGMEVILDVVYNHTAEGGAHGPMLSFRGIDNPAYYRLLPDSPGQYINDTGCGNTINADHPAVRRLVVDSLRYWTETMGVDGFRFDLATVLGRGPDGFDPEHPLLKAIAADPVVGRVKLIAEPWDVGPGGYQLGGFPQGWAEWNDRYRDAVRRFWRGDTGLAPEFARRVHGSADLFEPSGRGPAASVNFVASHDGFTTADLVSFAERHNEANGEDNRDGHRHNFSCNHGIEGATDDPEINARRRRHRLNLLVTLLLSHGTPMLLAGDEFGNSQHGNNNAYAQDNEIGWVDWSGLAQDPAFCEVIRHAAVLGRRLELIRQDRFLHGQAPSPLGHDDIEWLDCDGRPVVDDAWDTIESLCMLLTSTDVEPRADAAVAVLFNQRGSEERFTLASMVGAGHWRLELSTAESVELADDAASVVLPAASLACCVWHTAS